MHVDAKSRLARARLARPRREIENLKFSEGEPVLVWRIGRRGATAKVGPCYVIFQDGHTIWVTRRGEIWKCHVSQVFKMAVADQAGLEAIPAELLDAKARLRYDSEKMQFVDVASEAVEAAENRESKGPTDGPVKEEPQDDQQLPTEIPVPDPRLDEEPEVFSPDTPEWPPEERDLPQERQGHDLDASVPVSSVVRQDDQQLPAEIPVPDPAVINIDDSSSSSGGSNMQQEPPGSGSSQSTSSSSSSGSLSSSSTPRAPQGQAEWPPHGSGTELRKWSRFDKSPSRFRTSNSTGPMWSDVLQRVSIDNDSGKVIKRENFTGNETSRDLHRPLPAKVKSLRTVLVYKKVRGHPDPGEPLDHPDRPELDDGSMLAEDARLFDQRVKRSLDDVSGKASSSRTPMRKSRIFGAWAADTVTEYGDKSQLPAVANHRDMQLFYKLESGDVVYYDGEIYGSFVALTKQSGKELNEWNFSAEEVRMFTEAKRVEIRNLAGGNAIRFIRDRKQVEEIRKNLSHRIMPSRFILTKKSQELGEGWKAKARWILLGHRDPDVLELERFSPTPATTTVYLVFQLISSLRYRLYIMDVTSAFGQSDPEVRKQGPLYASLPRSGIPDEEDWVLIEVLTATYGLVNAPSAWRKTVVRVLLSLSYKESVFDPCLYYLPYNQEEMVTEGQRGCAGIVLLDVDDFAQGGNERHDRLMQQLRERFKFGKWRCLFQSHGEYLGRTIRQDETFEVRVDMQRYIEEKLRPIVLPREKLRQGDDAPLDEKEVTMLRGAGGSLLWVGKECRPDVGAACAMAMSWGKDGPTVRHVKAVNKTINELKKTSAVYLRILPIDLKEGIWMSISDASVANDDEKSQGGFLIAFVNREIKNGGLQEFSINSWKSHRVRRVVKASLGSEALAMDDGLAELEWVKAMFTEAVIPNSTVSDGTRFGCDESVAVVRQLDPEDPTILVTDARALYDLFHRRSGAAGLCRRAQIDVSVMASSAKALLAEVHWLPGMYMLADSLTKRLGNAALMRRVMSLGKYSIKQDGLQKLINLDAPPDGCDSLSMLPRCDQSVKSV